MQWELESTVQYLNILTFLRITKAKLIELEADTTDCVRMGNKFVYSCLVGSEDHNFFFFLSSWNLQYIYLLKNIHFVTSFSSNFIFDLLLFKDYLICYHFPLQNIIICDLDRSG